MTHALIAPVLLAASLAALAWFHLGAHRAFGRFRAMKDSAPRQRSYLRWAALGLVRNLGVALLGLALLGRIDAIWSFPEAFAALAWLAPQFPIDDPWFIPVLLTGLCLGGVLS
ncbi:MAG TPA: hypothetical protein VN029_03420, partial [Sphingomonas sp.]|nr:hypothetical protein [Sphingomonas sp.]